GGCSLFSSKNKHEPAKLQDVQQVRAIPPGWWRSMWSWHAGGDVRNQGNSEDQQSLRIAKRLRSSFFPMIRF
ncbi:hypothetical protein ACQCQ7_20820, partial [Ralstonia pseudosolanacearum]|uniref:hypothetical protein n=1 Tax=Ralstonia pseudosolanacearum TaxID=1310165 RepID=UPI003CF0896C